MSSVLKYPDLKAREREKLHAMVVGLLSKYHRHLLENKMLVVEASQVDSSTGIMVIAIVVIANRKGNR